MPIAKTGDIFRARVQCQRSVAEIEANWVLGHEFNVFLIAVCIDCNRQFDDAFLEVNSRFFEFIFNSFPITEVYRPLRKRALSRGKGLP